MSEAEIDGFRRMICEQVPMGRFGTAEEAARSVLYLAPTIPRTDDRHRPARRGGAVSF
jgi:NAD(P)-dependent dehydrogenase (short-subunit alcohol dehydrogenase family)